MWWIIAFTLPLILSGLMIRKTWLKWDQSPTVLSHANQATSIRDIPFPAVTICSDIKFRRETLNLRGTLRMMRSDGLESKANISHEI